MRMVLAYSLVVIRLTSPLRIDDSLGTGGEPNEVILQCTRGAAGERTQKSFRARPRKVTKVTRITDPTPVTSIHSFADSIEVLSDPKPFSVSARSVPKFSGLQTPLRSLRSIH